MGIRRFAGPILLVVFIGLMVWSYISMRAEGFGATSRGTMIQLKTSHVPTEEDVVSWMNEGHRVKQELSRMTY